MTGRPAEALTYTIPGAARAIGVSATTVRLLIDRGDLPALKIGRRVLVVKADLEEWLRANANRRLDGHPKREAS